MDVRYQEISHGITTIDTGLGRPGFTASHLIVEDGQAAFVDVGTTLTIPALLTVLQHKQIPREQVKYLIVTHVHLDHAGATGKLLADLPCARVVVHPRGSRHLISPERLIAGATAVYGADFMQTLFGEIVPVPQERIVEAEHESCLQLNARQLLFLDTPGHARHHCCVFDERSQGMFTGDSFGVSYREFDTNKGNFIFPATAPVQFEPEKMHASIDLLLMYRPKRLYLTHFGCVTDVPRLAAELHERIDQFVEIARGVRATGQARHLELTRQITELMVSRLKSHDYGSPDFDALSADLQLNVMGLEVWLDRLQKKQQNTS